MISIDGKPTRSCSGLSRRQWLCVGGLSTMGLMLPELLGRESSAAEPAPEGGGRYFGRAKSCIVCFLFGAPAHQDIWDLKPEAASEVRGEFSPISSSVPGTMLGEHIPKTAALAHRYAVVRSVAHPDNTHTVAMHYMLTGTRHLRPRTNPENEPSDFPTFGAVVRHLRPSGQALPSGISLNSPANQVSANNHIFPGFFAGFLGSQRDPLFISQDPSQPDFRPFPTSGVAGPERLRTRGTLLERLDHYRRTFDFESPILHYSQHHERAFSLVSSPEAARAFDLERETAATRERYGKSSFGQGLILARRLVEAGVRLVTVNWARDDAFWDTHANNFSQLKQSLLPPFDTGFSALLDDLDQRGLLDETLVVALGEFGRTPKINKNAGRDHWAACNSVVLAGAGIRGGLVYGASDTVAAYPTLNPVGPEDLAATIYYALGIPGRTWLVDQIGRRLPLTGGRPLVELFG